MAAGGCTRVTRWTQQVRGGWRRRPAPRGPHPRLTMAGAEAALGLRAPPLWEPQGEGCGPPSSNSGRACSCEVNRAPGPRPRRLPGSPAAVSGSSQGCCFVSSHSISAHQASGLETGGLWKLYAHRAGGTSREAGRAAPGKKQKQPSRSQRPASDLPSHGPVPSPCGRQHCRKPPRGPGHPSVCERSPPPSPIHLTCSWPDPTFSRGHLPPPGGDWPSDKPLPRSRFSSIQSITWRAQKPYDDLRQLSSGLPLSVKASGCGLLSWLVSRVRPPTLLHKKIKTELEPRARRLKRARGEGGEG